MEAFSQPEIVEQFYSSALNRKTTARKTTRLATVPDYLLVHLKKFTLREDWVPIKLDVSVEMPDVLDLTQLRGTGPQAGEEPLPELTETPPAPVLNEQLISDLISFGFHPEACKKAVYFTKNSSLDSALQWLQEHSGDSDLENPFVPPGTDMSKGNFQQRKKKIK